MVSTLLTVSVCAVIESVCVPLAGLMVRYGPA